MTSKAALVTGGATGIGRETAKLLAARGYKVAVNHLAQSEVADELAIQIGGRAYDVDVADALAMQGMVDAIEEELGPIEVAVCSAGFAIEATLELLSDDLWDRTMAVLLGGCVNALAALAPKMRSRGKGSVVTISSELALVGAVEHAHYVAAKAAVLGLTKAMAKELAPSGIRVNCIAPGPTDTGLLTDRWREGEYLASIPLGRLGRPEEVASAIVSLAEDSWTTGQVYSPNGGVVIQ